MRVSPRARACTRASSAMRSARRSSPWTATSTPRPIDAFTHVAVISSQPRQRRLERRDALGRGPAAAPERHERADQAQLRRVRARAVQECDGGREVGALGLELEEAHRGLVQRDGRLGELREVVGVPLPAGALLVRRARELVGRELPDRLGHAEAPGAVRLGAPRHEMLLDEGLERVGSRLADRFRAVPRGVAGEDGEAAEEPPLALVEQVRRPLRGRAQRALTGVRARAAVEQVEPLAQARQQLCRREDGRAGGRELERQRQAVEAPAELGHLGGRHEGGVDAARPLDVELDGVLLAERRHRIGGLAAQPEAFAARHQQRSGRRSRAARRSRRPSQPARARRCRRAAGRAGRAAVPRARAALRVHPARRRVRSARRPAPGRAPGARATKCTPSGNASAASAAASSARCVLPTPPGPVSVSKPAPSRSAATTDASSPCRPTSGVDGRGRRACCGTAGQAGRRAGRGARRSSCWSTLRCSERSAAEGSMPSPLDESASRLAIRLERLGLPAVAVEREHQRAVQPLPQRVLADQPAQLTDHLGVMPAGQVRVDALGDAVQAQLLEACDLGLCERLAPHVGQGGAAPQRERLAQRRSPPARPARPPARRGPARAGRRSGPRRAHRVPGAPRSCPRARRSRRARAPCARARPRPGRRSAGSRAGSRPTSRSSAMRSPCTSAPPCTSRSVSSESGRPRSAYGVSPRRASTGPRIANSTI